jgi:hypothetical protein
MYILYRTSRPDGTEKRGEGQASEDAGGYQIALFALENSAWQGTAQGVHAARAAADEAVLSAHSNAGATWRQQALQRPASQAPSFSSRSADSTVEFTVQILPDPHFGLGVRIDVLNGKTVVSSFKKHPITNKAMSAQAAGSILPGDEFVAINGECYRACVCPFYILLRPFFLLTFIVVFFATYFQVNSSAV